VTFSRICIAGRGPNGGASLIVVGHYEGLNLSHEIQLLEKPNERGPTRTYLKTVAGKP
jgi:hypothetical protein